MESKEEENTQSQTQKPISEAVLTHAVKHGFAYGDASAEFGSETYLEKIAQSNPFPLAGRF